MSPKTSKIASVAKTKRATTKNRSNSSTVTNIRGSKGTVPTRIVSLLDASPVSELLNDVVKPVPTTRNNNINSYERLSTIVHGIFLVTMVKMAQLGVFHSELNITTVVDDRWLGGLVRYCGFTVTLPDIIECGAAFSDWLKVTVSVSPNSVRQKNGNEIIEEITPANNTESPTNVKVKLKLIREGVPTISESREFLAGRWENSQDWKNDVSLLLHGTVHPTVSGSTEMKKDLPVGNMESMKKTTSTNINNYEDEDVADDEELLAQLSEELRASLSKEKLRSVLNQMRRDALGLDAKEQEEISKRQRRERLLSTYDLVRSVLGETRSLCNMGVLIKQMMAQNRFDEDMEKLLQQLASLVKYNESGITVYALDEEQTQEQEGKKENGVNKEMNGATTSLKIRNVDLVHCTLRDLDSVLLRLDRQQASRAELHLALQRE